MQGDSEAEIVCYDRIRKRTTSALQGRDQEKRDVKKEETFSGRRLIKYITMIRTCIVKRKTFKTSTRREIIEIERG